MRHVGREPYSDNLVNGFAVIRMKERYFKDWHHFNDHGREDSILKFRGRPQAVGFIALTPLSVQNGFFMPLAEGENVLIDSKANIHYPNTGGGLAIAIWLRL